MVLYPELDSAGGDKCCFEGKPQDLL